MSAVEYKRSGTRQRRMAMRLDAVTLVRGCISDRTLPEWITSQLARPRSYFTQVLELCLMRTTRGRLGRRFAVPPNDKPLARHPLENSLRVMKQLARARQDKVLRNCFVVYTFHFDARDALLDTLVRRTKNDHIYQLTPAGVRFADLHTGWQYDDDLDVIEMLRVWCDYKETDEQRRELFDRGLLEIRRGHYSTSTSGRCLIRRVLYPNRRIPQRATQRRERVQVVPAFDVFVDDHLKLVVEQQQKLLDRFVLAGEVVETAVFQILK